MQKLVTHSPFSGQKTHEYQYDSIESVREKIAVSRRVQMLWKQHPLGARIDLVRGALDYFSQNRDEIARDITQQMGRPLEQAKGEISGLLERGQYMCEIAESTLAPDVIEDSDQFYRAIEHEAHGLVFVISAWNYPLLITINSVVPALISGNTVALKHSSLTPEIGVHFERAFGQLGEFHGLLQNLILDHAVTGQAIEELPIDHVIFTGSVSGGRKILQHTSKKFMTPQLELGGKDGAYVHADADVDHAVGVLVDGAMFNSGQSCCGIERVYVHESIYENFIKKSVAITQDYILGDPLQATTTQGPLASPKSVDFMLEQISEAVSKGAKVLIGGQDRKIGEGRFMEPTLLVDVDHTMDILKEENFGPVLPIVSVSGVEEAIGKINDSNYGLTSAIFTRDESVAREFSRHADTGTVFMNRCDYLDPALPWTGVKNSGCGSSLSKFGFHGVTRRKSIHFKKS